MDAAMKTTEAAAETVNHTYQILADKLDWFKKQMARLQKRAAKMGCAAPFYTLGERYLVTETRLIPGYSQEDVEVMGPEMTMETVKIAKYEVVISGVAPKYAGWTFAATLQHLAEGETIIRSIAGLEAPVAYRTAASDCQHCKYARRRNDTFLVRHDNGEWKQVGSTCIADFLGHESPDALAAQAEFLADAMGLGLGGEEGFGRKVDSADIVSFLTTTAVCIEMFGWLSKKVAYDRGGVPTAGHVISVLFGRSNADRKLQDDVRKATTEAHGQLAQAAYEWVISLEGELSDYLHNIRAIARAGEVESRTAGYAASIIVAYKKHLEMEEERKSTAAKLNEHFGTVGERTTLTLTVKSVKFVEGYMGGSSALHVMEDAQGRSFKWFASSGESMGEGTTVTVVATVKKHDEYKGRKQTMLSRVVEFIEKPKKNTANKKVAAGLVAFFQGLMEPYQIAQALVAFVTDAVKLYTDYHNQVAWGIQGFLYAVHEEVRQTNHQISRGIENFIRFGMESEAQEALVMGRSIAGFMVWADQESDHRSWGYHQALRELRYLSHFRLLPTNYRQGY